MSTTRQIVDENDTLLGVKKSSDMDYGRDIYRVSALWVTNPKGEVLLAQRSLRNNNSPGLWGPAVSGTVEEGETYESNIHKEAEEEIGLSEITFEEGPKVRFSITRQYFCQWFTVQVDREASDFRLQEDEVEAVRWFTRDELRNQISEKSEKFLSEMKEIVELFVSRSEA
jgi:isopentenyldiphosphate isomerase